MFTKARDTGTEPREPVMATATPPAAALPRRTPNSAPSIVSADMTIVGAITAGGDIQVDGTVEGDICADSLTVGENAVIKGEILAEEVIVHGVVEGSIRAERVQLCAGAQVHGDLLHAGLAVERGAVFEGNSRHSEDPLGRQSAKPPAREPAPAMRAGPDVDGADFAGSDRQPSRNMAPAAETGRPDGPGAGPKPDPARAKPPVSAASAQDGNTPAKSPANGDLGKISPGRMRAGGSESSPAANPKPK